MFGYVLYVQIVDLRRFNSDKTGDNQTISNNNQHVPQNGNCRYYKKKLGVKGLDMVQVSSKQCFNYHLNVSAESIRPIDEEMYIHLQGRNNKTAVGITVK